MKMRFALPLSVALSVAVLLPAAQATTWDEGSDPYAYSADFGSDAYGSVPDDGYEAGLGVDPLYATPSGYEDAPSGSSRRPRFAPADGYMEYFGQMSFSSQPGRIEMTNAMITLPLVDPRRAEWKGWHLDVKGSLRATWINTMGNDVLDEDDLYTIGLRATVARSVGEASQIQLGFTPSVSTDFDVMTHDIFYWGGYAAFSSKAGEKLRYTIGVACMPGYYRSDVLPVLGLEWRYNPAWELRVQASRISAVCVANEKFQWGPFFQWNTAAWTVQRYRRTRQLRTTNCIAGIGATYDLKLQDGTIVSLLGDFGGTFYNSFRVYDRDGHHSLERYRAHPGIYLRAGVQVSF